jgi:hypothetical protein
MVARTSRIAAPNVSNGTKFSSCIKYITRTAHSVAPIVSGTGYDVTDLRHRGVDQPVAARPERVAAGVRGRLGEVEHAPELERVRVDVRPQPPPQGLARVGPRADRCPREDRVHPAVGSRALHGAAEHGFDLRAPRGVQTPGAEPDPGGSFVEIFHSHAVYAQTLDGNSGRGRRAGASTMWRTFGWAEVAPTKSGRKPRAWYRHSEFAVGWLSRR